MKEVHIRQPIWNGDRSEVYVGIKRGRVVNEYSQPYKCQIRVWIDYKERDGSVFYPYPFQIECAEVLKYKPMTLNDFTRTVIYIVPLSALREVRNYRSGSPRGRSIIQSDFKDIKEHAKYIQENERSGNIH